MGDGTKDAGSITYSRLPKVANPGTWVIIPLESFPRLYQWHARCAHAGTFTSPSVVIDDEWKALSLIIDYYLNRNEDIFAEYEEQSSLSSSVVASIVSALRCLLCICGSSLRPWMRHIFILEHLIIVFPEHFKPHIYANSGCPSDRTSIFSRLLWASLHSFFL
jgi:hypothetical protein